jgi:putative ABC transport system permease protein
MMGTPLVASLYIELSWVQVALAAALVIVSGALSIVLRLGMEKSLAIASVRTVVQLSLIGVVLTWVFAVDKWYIVVSLMVFMTLTAGHAALQRISRRYKGDWLDGVIAMGVSTWTILAYAVFVVLRDVDPWYRPQYTVPLMGMLLGNALNGVSLGIGRLGDELVARRPRIETLLALGATRWEAANESLRTAIRTGMTPIANAMMVVGLVSLPGMMTGQILAGATPMHAVGYQIVIMFLIAAATALGTVVSVLLAYRRFFNDRHQFEYWRLR